jgi:hypothetical protein
MSRRRSPFSNRLAGDWLVGNWLALGAIIISVCSLSVSIEQCAEARLHDQPRLTYTYYCDDTGAGWRLDNTGLGPARLRGFKMTVDGKPVTDLTQVCDWLGLPQPCEFNFTNPRVGDLYASGHETILFWVKPGHTADTLRKAWRHLDIEACYCSIHDQCWRFDSSTEPDPNGDPRDDDCEDFARQAHSRWWNG